MVDSTSQALINCSWMADTRASVLNAIPGLVLAQVAHGKFKLADDQLQPKFLNMMDDDEQRFILPVAQRHLSGEQRIELQVVAIGHAFRLKSRRHAAFDTAVLASPLFCLHGRIRIRLFPHRQRMRNTGQSDILSLNYLQDTLHWKAKQQLSQFVWQMRYKAATSDPDAQGVIET